MGGLAASRASSTQTVDENARRHRPGAPAARKHGQVLGLLTKLSQICNHPALPSRKGGHREGFSARSAKLQRLEENVDECDRGGRSRPLLFTQFAEWGHLLKRPPPGPRKRFARKCPFPTQHQQGGAPGDGFDRFQDDPAAPSCSAVAEAGRWGGLNLTAPAPPTGFFSPHRSLVDPAVEDQATTGTYRISARTNGLAGAQVHPPAAR